MGKLGEPYTAATVMLELVMASAPTLNSDRPTAAIATKQVVNNIFRNYEHQWVYDFEEMTRTAMAAGIPRTAVRCTPKVHDWRVSATESAKIATLVLRRFAARHEWGKTCRKAWSERSTWQRPS